MLSHLKNIVVFSSLLLSISCNNSDSPEPKASSIKAGEVFLGTINQTFNPPLQIELENSSIGGIPSTELRGSLGLDITQDGTIDATFESFEGIGCNVSGCFVPTEGTTIQQSNSNILLEFHPSPLSASSLIDENLEWQLMIFASPLSSYIPESTTSTEETINPWNSEDAYLAIRLTLDDQIYYGWISLQIENTNELSIFGVGTTLSN